jgi:NADPH-dependent 2,4-dienoyl-CoA reductase/sulfur reductase-like enzyme
VVAGAGPAGLEAARVAALRGHRVVVFERRPEVGGQLQLWAKLPGRENYRGFVEWSRERLRELGVTVHTGVAAGPERILELEPDAVVVAAGARYAPAGESGYAPDPIPGWDRDLVHRPEQVLEGGARPGGVVVVLDEEGINTGPGVAEILARAGAHVHLVTRHAQLMGNLAFDGHAPILLPRLIELGVRIHTQMYLRRIGEREATLVDVVTSTEQVITPVDAVVLATMRRPESALAARLAGSVPQVFAVGDALAPRGLAEATFEGQRFARLIGEPGAPRTTSEALLLPAAGEAFPRPAAALGADR